MSIPSTTRRIVLARAAGCCEYCRLGTVSAIAPFHVDHIIPVKHGGHDGDDNLALACYTCNAYKSHDLAGIDPATGEITPLFHPRKQLWEEHFVIQSNMWINGLTPIGRTTIQVLHINAPERIENRQILAELGEYPCF